MTYKIPPTTKLFLSKLMEEKIHQNVGGNYIDFKKSYLTKFNNLQEAEEKKKDETPQNFGTGLTAGKENKPNPKTPQPQPGYNPIDFAIDQIKSLKNIKNPADIMLGDTDLGGTLMTPVSYFLGGVVEYLMKSKAAPHLANAVASKIPGGLGRALGGKMGRAVGKAGEAFSDILGSSYIDVNADDIAFQNTKNLIQGAGKPFYQLQVPVRQDDKYDWWRRQALVQQQQP